MRARRCWFGLLGTLALAGLSAPAHAQAVGSEFQVNTYTTGNQETISASRHVVAADASGNFVVVWYGSGPGDPSFGIFGQRYDSAGSALGGEFRVNSYTTSVQALPSVASDASGNFVVVWQSGFRGISAQRYDSGGAAVGGEFRVDSYPTGTKQAPAVASDASGNFVVAWTDRGQDGDQGGIFGQRFNSGGVPQGSEFQINSYTTSDQLGPTVASDAGGNFVVAWLGAIDQDGEGWGIFGQRYDSGGVAQGSEFRVNSFTSGTQFDPSVASDANGNFVVVWHSYQDGYRFGIYGQRYDSAGAAQGTEFRINSYTAFDQVTPAVAFDAGGNFVVVWESVYQDGSSFGLFGQRFDSAGLPQGTEFRVNSYTPGYQRFASVAATGTNGFVVAWTSHDGQDGSGYGVFGRRIDPLPSLSLADVTVREGNPSGESKRTPARFTVTLSAASEQPVIVQYATADDTAQAPWDYKAQSGALTLNPGQTSASIVVAVRKDLVVEPTETFLVNLSSPTNATIADGQAVGKIRNDDQ
jgi:hypothetical protein